ncbi:MAG: hypothetical protein AB1345_09175 [Chloroflexota bacterium]
MNTTDVWSLTLKTVRALREHFLPAMDKAVEELGIPPNNTMVLLAALTFEPRTTSNAKLQVRMPYQDYSQILTEAVQHHLLSRVGEEEFRLTDKGKKAANTIIQAAYQGMAGLEPLPLSDLEKVASFLFRVVNTCLAAPVPPGKWSISHSRRIDPSADAPVIIRIEQIITDLIAYRDDSHLAAWQPHDFSGPEWETLTVIWLSEADTLDALVEKLSRRGFVQSTYEGEIARLKARGLVQEHLGKLQVTAEGKELRQKAEDLTDQYFYAPWACLNEEEKQSLGELLTRLSENLSL